MIRFELTSLMPVEPEVAFDLSLSIDLHVDAFARSDEQAIGGTVSGQIELGEFVTWRARHFGRTWTMTSVITEWERPRRFVDEQHRGPFKSFRHEHLFTPVENGTQMIDQRRIRGPVRSDRSYRRTRRPRSIPAPPHRRSQHVSHRRGDQGGRCHERSTRR